MTFERRVHPKALARMYIAARVFGVIWIVGVAFAGAVLIGSGRIRGGRGEMLLLIAAALPGFLMYRWGRNSGL